MFRLWVLSTLPHIFQTTFWRRQQPRNTNAPTGSTTGKKKSVLPPNLTLSSKGQVGYLDLHCFWAVMRHPNPSSRVISEKTQMGVEVFMLTEDESELQGMSPKAVTVIRRGLRGRNAGYQSICQNSVPKAGTQVCIMSLFSVPTTNLLVAA